jgi:predicted lipid carrier protein YhbT
MELKEKFSSFPGPLAPLSKLVSRLPSFPPSVAFSGILNLALGRIIRKDALEPLHGKLILIRVTDLGLRVHFTIGPSGFRPTMSDAMPDLAISATARDFYLLSTRKEDPDTLFFSRRLVVEGDTELGLVAKNTLDAVELPKAVDFAPRQALARLKARLMQG